MTEHFKNSNFSAPQQSESDVLGLMKKVQQQLVFLERKIDILISQSQEKPLREKPFSKHSRPFERPYRSEHHHGKKDRVEDFKEKKFRPGQYSQKHRAEEKRGKDDQKKEFGGKKKHSFHKRKDH